MSGKLNVASSKHGDLDMDNSTQNNINDQYDCEDDYSFDEDECDDPASNMLNQSSSTAAALETSSHGGGSASTGNKISGRAVVPSGMKSRSSNGNRRNRVFIDPISEVPVLERYFAIETYPDHFLIEKICENLNQGEYRFKFPKLESRNIQLWFKNHRAKLKRIKTGGGNATGGASSSSSSTPTTVANLNQAE